MSTPMKKTTIGGQAIIEGIVMRGPYKTCTVVRKSNGELVTKEADTKRSKGIWRKPVFRGMYSLFSSLGEGLSAINYSASFFEDEETDAPPSKFELWLEKHLSSEALEKAILGFSSIFGILLPVLLFFLLPSFISGFLPKEAGVLGRNLVEAGARIIIFLIFMWLVSHMKDIKRTFEYHGAEHKTIFCYEAGDELTVENVRRQGRFHPRCGTSFMFILIIISTLVSSIVFSFIQISNPWLRMVAHLILLPLVVGLSFECSQYSGRHEHLLARAVRWPGLMVQRLTVFEPDDSMIEVAIEAMNAVIPQDNSDNW